MQRSVRQSLEYAAHISLGHDVEPSDIITDFGFNYDHNEVLSCWFALRNWHILPYSGGWLDQPVAWRQDLQSMQTVYNEQVDIIEQRIEDIPSAPPQANNTGAEIRLGIFDGT